MHSQASTQKLPLKAFDLQVWSRNFSRAGIGNSGTRSSTGLKTQMSQEKQSIRGTQTTECLQQGALSAPPGDGQCPAELSPLPKSSSTPTLTSHSKPARPLRSQWSGPLRHSTLSEGRGAQAHHAAGAFIHKPQLLQRFRVSESHSGIYKSRSF